MSDVDNSPAKFLVIPPETQQILNKPLKHDGAMSQEDTQFLGMLIEKIEKKEIQLYQPSSLLNKSVYEKLNEEAQGKVDFDAFNLLAVIREIYNLWKMQQRDTYQIENLVHRIRLTKERLEELGGDLYIF